MVTVCGNTETPPQTLLPHCTRLTNDRKLELVSEVTDRRLLFARSMVLISLARVMEQGLPELGYRLLVSGK